MLNVRVFVQGTSGDRSMIWQGARAETYPGQEDRSLRRWTMLASDPDYVGRVFDMRFTDGDGSGCRVEGALVGAQVAAQAEGHEIDVIFSSDNHQAW